MAITALLRKQGYLITRSQALAAGMTDAALRNKLRPDGPWKVILPGVYLAGTGPMTIGQRELAAVLYAGHGCVVTGTSALRRQGVRVPVSDDVAVLIPEPVKRGSLDFVRVIRTRRMPPRILLIDDIRYAPVARAVADAVRGQVDLRSVTALVADAVQRGACSVEQLAAELRAAPAQGSSSLRIVLAKVADGIASVAEADLRDLIKRSDLPEPLYNASLYVGSKFLARPDAWWPDAGVAAEVDSREFHLSPAGWEITMARHSRMSAQGIIVLHFPPSRIKSDPAGVIAELTSALSAGRQRPPLAVLTAPAR